MGDAMGDRVVIRKLANYNEIVNNGLGGLGYKPQILENIKKATLYKNNGLIIISGATGSGKSTLLYTVLEELRKKNKDIYTIENPIEILMPGIAQFDLDRTADAEEYFKLTIDKAMAIALRQRPSVVLLSEVREGYEMDGLLGLGEKGHMAMTTIHANDVLSSLRRFDDEIKDGVVKGKLQNFLNLVIHQDLIRKKCQNCNGKGCEKCKGRGVSGVMPLYEQIFVKKKFTINDDIYDLERMVAEDKIDYYSKAKLIREYAKESIIFDEDYEIFKNNTLLMDELRGF